MDLKAIAGTVRVGRPWSITEQDEGWLVERGCQEPRVIATATEALSWVREVEAAECADRGSSCATAVTWTTTSRVGAMVVKALQS